MNNLFGLDHQLSLGRANVVKAYLAAPAGVEALRLFVLGASLPPRRSRGKTNGVHFRLKQVGSDSFEACREVEISAEDEGEGERVEAGNVSVRGLSEAGPGDRMPP